MEKINVLLTTECVFINARNKSILETKTIAMIQSKLKGVLESEANMVHLEVKNGHFQT